MPRKRRLPGQDAPVTEKEAERSAIAGFLADMVPSIREEAPRPEPAVTPDPYGEDPPYEDPASFLESDAHDYVKRQVLSSLYGTDRPSDHDRKILSIKERMNRYG